MGFLKLRSSPFAVITLAIAGSWASGSFASTYSNAFDSVIGLFGFQNSTNFGQVFTAPAESTLLDLTFSAASGTAGNLKLVIATWDGEKALGPALYSSSPFAYEGFSQGLVFSGINLNLTAGVNYIAFLTVAGVDSPATNMGIYGSSTDGGLGGGFRYLNSNNVDPLTLSNPWDSLGIPNMHFIAHFADADTDADGLADPVDNCTLEANNDPGTVPNSNPPVLKSQLDADGDGYGNACDGDLNNTGLVTAQDNVVLRNQLNQLASANPTAAAADLNGSGLVTAQDNVILRNQLNTAPGPSGLACAGTIPCP